MDNVKIYKDGTCNIFKNSEINFNDESYIVSAYDMIIGHFNVININNYLSIEYELLKKYRDKNMGNFLFYIIEKYVYENYDFDKILLLIKYDNFKSRRIAIENNYKIDYMMEEKLADNGELTMYNAFIKYKENKKEKVLI